MIRARTLPLAALLALLLAGCTSRQAGESAFQAANSSMLGVPVNSAMAAGRVPTINATTFFFANLLQPAAP